MITQIKKDLQKLWGTPFEAEMDTDADLILFKPVADYDKFPLTISFEKLTDIHTNFHTFFEEENRNYLVNLHSLIEEFDEEKTPLLLIGVHNTIYSVFRYTSGRKFYEDIKIPKNKLVINYQLSKITRIHETLIIVRWKDFFKANNTSRKKQYLNKIYK